MLNIDQNLINADWPKQTWDLPPYKSPEFMALGFDLHAFRKLPVYDAAVANGLIKDDEWVGPDPEIVKALEMIDPYMRKLERRFLHGAIPGSMLLRKIEPTGVHLAPVSFERPAMRRGTRTLARVITRFFNEIKPVLIKQVTEAYGKLHKADDADLQEIDDIMGVVDLTVFNNLPKQVQAQLEDAFDDAGEEALKTVGAAVTASRVEDLELAPKAFDTVNANAVEYADARSAEMVGMKWVNGKLIPNPDAKWQILDETRDGIRSAVQAAVVGDLPVTKLADTLSQSYGFSSARASTIARTEMRMANGNGALAGYIASGVVQEKVWLTAGDDDVSEECADNEDEGPIAVDDDFPSGDACEPAHPNCRCTIAPYVDFGQGGDEE